MEKDIEKAICEAESEKEEAKDWTSIWGKRYPVLLSYPSRINSEPYEERLGSLLDEIGKEGGFGRLDSYLVLKDILWKLYRKEKGESGPSAVSFMAKGMEEGGHGQ